MMNSEPVDDYLDMLDRDHEDRGKCEECAGNGWYTGIAGGTCLEPLPVQVQVQCEACEGTGWKANNEKQKAPEDMPEVMSPDEYPRYRENFDRDW